MRGASGRLDLNSFSRCSVENRPLLLFFLGGTKVGCWLFDHRASVVEREGRGLPTSSSDISGILLNKREQTRVERVIRRTLCAKRTTSGKASPKATSSLSLGHTLFSPRRHREIGRFSREGGCREINHLSAAIFLIIRATRSNRHWRDKSSLRPQFVLV